MLNKVDIIKISKHILRRDQGRPDHSLMHSGRDWLIGLILTTLMFVGGGAWAGYYYHYLITLEPEVAPLQPVSRVEHDQLDRGIAIYTKRQAVYESALAAPVSQTAVDVSTTSSSVESSANIASTSATTTPAVTPATTKSSNATSSND